MSCNRGNINYKCLEPRFISSVHDHAYADQLSCIRLYSRYFCSGLQVCIRLFTLSSQGHDHCKLLYSDHSNNWVSISIFLDQNQYSVFLSQFQYKILMNQYS